MKIVSSIVFLIILIIAAGYFFLASNKGLLDKDYALKIASNALGDRLYGSTCARDQYIESAQELGNNSSFIFVFSPKPMADSRCSVTKIIVDRKTGELWVAN